MDAFDRICFELTDKEYGKLLVDVWIDSENIWQNLELWGELWNEATRRHAMDAKERKALNALPDEITIYRGAGEKYTLNGMSWTLDRDKAIWFAPLSHQLVTDWPRVVLRKPTMDEISRHACWHFQPSL